MLGNGLTENKLLLRSIQSYELPNRFAYLAVIIYGRYFVPLNVPCIYTNMYISYIFVSVFENIIKMFCMFDPNLPGNNQAQFPSRHQKAQLIEERSKKASMND